jgi:hypothetical protein
MEPFKFVYHTETREPSPGDVLQALTSQASFHPLVVRAQRGDRDCSAVLLARTSSRSEMFRSGLSRAKQGTLVGTGESARSGDERPAGPRNRRTEVRLTRWRRTIALGLNHCSAGARMRSTRRATSGSSSVGPALLTGVSAPGLLGLRTVSCSIADTVGEFVLAVDNRGYGFARLLISPSLRRASLLREFADSIGSGTENRRKPPRTRAKSDIPLSERFPCGRDLLQFGDRPSIRASLFKLLAHRLIPPQSSDHGRPLSLLLPEFRLLRVR